MKITRNCTLGFVLVLFLQIVRADVSNNTSVYPTELEDPRAVYVKPDAFEVSADGVADDAPAIQAAIDSVLNSKRGQGVVFIPEGTYRLASTVRLWEGIRLIGYGSERPIFKLAKNSPGFQDGTGKYLVQFCESPRDSDGAVDGVWPADRVEVGDGGTHFSAIININFEIEDGNSAAVAVSYGAARNTMLKNIDFHIGSGLGAVERVGNIIENCRFFGGEWAIFSERSTMDLPVLVQNCLFDGQREQAIHSFFAGYTVTQSEFKNMPIGILGRVFERLYVSDTYFENISEAALRVRNYVSPELHINMHNVVCSDVPVSVRFSGRAAAWSTKDLRWVFDAPAPVYQIKSFSHGRHIGIPNTHPKLARFETHIDQVPLESKPDAMFAEGVTALDASGIANVVSLGATGDGETDSTKIIQAAIDQYETLYFPIGEYVISKEIRLKERTKLIGLHPGLTKFVIKDDTAGFTNARARASLITLPTGSAPGISGIGFDLGKNPGIVGIDYRASRKGFLDDLYFGSDTSEFSEDAEQAASLWVNGGAAGKLKNIWFNDGRTSRPLRIQNTDQAGSLYQVSVGHHPGYELELESVKNWSFFGLDLNEELGGESYPAVSLKNVENILFANFTSRRGAGLWEPSPYAILAEGVRDSVFCGAEFVGAVFPYENALFDGETDTAISYRVFSNLVVNP